MPFANLKVPAGTISAEQKRLIVDRVTDLYVEIYGERARAGTMVLVEEVADGGWGIGGGVLTAAMLEDSPPDAQGGEASRSPGCVADCHVAPAPDGAGAHPNVALHGMLAFHGRFTRH